MIESIVVFDFDDTLFPTTFLSQFDYDKMMLNPKFESLLFNLLLEAIEINSSVYIVTNAQTKWIDYCLENLIPRIKFLRKYINVISALEVGLILRQSEPNFDVANLSKSVVFDNMISSLDSKKQYQLLSIGDGLPEQQATLYIKNKYPHVTTKFIKFVTKPNYRDLYEQLLLIKKTFKNILKEKNGFDLSMKNQNNNQFTDYEESLFQEPEEVEKDLLW